MRGKQVVDFLVLRSAFTRRNFTSLFLVGVFFAVYILSGGKVTTKLPKLQGSGSFGNVDSASNAEEKLAAQEAAERQKAMQVLGVTESADRQERENSVNGRGRLFSAEVDGAGDEPIDKSGLIQPDDSNRKEEAKLRKLERRQQDSLLAIEERLKIKRK